MTTKNDQPKDDAPKDDSALAREPEVIPTQKYNPADDEDMPKFHNPLTGEQGSLGRG
jgi:hypothetical protein